MIRVKNILVPVDFSEPSKKAVNYGLSLCLEFKARLILTQIVPYDALAYRTAKASLLELIPAAYREKLNFEIIVKGGDISQELLGIVEEKDIDLVVMDDFIYGEPVELPAVCRADFNADGAVNSSDFFDFLIQFFANAVDFNQDGLFNSQDLYDFLTEWNTGCGHP